MNISKFLMLSLLTAGTLFLTGCGDGSPEQAMNRAVALANKGDWEKADKVAERVARKNPQLAAAQILRAVTAERCGDRETALDSARRAVALDPANFAAQYTLGRLYAADTARSSEAEQALLRAMKMQPDDLHVKILLCNVAMGANSPRASVYMTFLTALPEFSKSAELKNQLAVNSVRRGSKKYREAQRHFLAALRMPFTPPEVILNVARFYDGCMKDKQKALLAYQDYLKKAGENASGKVEAAARISRLSSR